MFRKAFWPFVFIFLHSQWIENTYALLENTFEQRAFPHKRMFKEHGVLGGYLVRSHMKEYEFWQRKF